VARNSREAREARDARDARDANEAKEALKGGKGCNRGKGCKGCNRGKGCKGGKQGKGGKGDRSDRSGKGCKGGRGGRAIFPAMRLCGNAMQWPVHFSLLRCSLSNAAPRPVSNSTTFPLKRLCCGQNTDYYCFEGNRGMVGHETVA
jgi:hypothetical protein